MRFSAFLFLFSLIASLSACSSERQSVPPWLPGIWKMTADEDNGPLGELVEFTVDSKYYFYGKDCLSMKPLGFHIHDGDIYVTNTIQGKGPVSVIFHPADDRSTLVFTSPRTFNNAIYRKTPLTACQTQR